MRRVAYTCSLSVHTPPNTHLQGRFLTTPELVPFRLTRDIVDGMGSPGLEGPLRRCVWGGGGREICKTQKGGCRTRGVPRACQEGRRPHRKTW
jgi:hypothetical protein